MNWKRSIISILLLIVSKLIFCQDLTQTVKGKVIDEDSKTPLIGVNIILKNSDPIVGVTTDIDGNFKIRNVPIGRQSFIVSYIGYENVFINEVLVETGKELVLNISMPESIEELDAVVVIAKDNKTVPLNKMATVSATQITVESTSRIAAGINDPARTIQSTAGIAASSDKGNDLVIRGNSPRGVLWRMEGVEIPNPNHFSNEGSSGGGVSALSTQVLSNSDFFTGAFPAEYGNALSGVFDLKLRNGNYDNREYTAQIRVMGVQFAAEGPFIKGKKASYLFNYRYSTFELLDDLAGINLGGTVPSWQDLSFKVHLPSSNAGNFSVWGLGGLSSSQELADSDTSNWESSDDALQESVQHILGVTGLSHNYWFYNSKTYIKTTIAQSYSANDLFEDTISYSFESFAISDVFFSYKTVTANSFINHKFNARHTIRIGATYKFQQFELSMNDYNYDTQEHIQIIDNLGSTDNYESYIQWKYKITSRVEANTGVHASLYNLNNQKTLEPRLGVKWKQNDKNTFTCGFGLHSRLESISIYLSEGTNS